MQQREDNEAESEKKESVEKEEQQNKQIRDMGQVILNENSNKYKVELLTIIGEVEGHESAPSHSKTTKYEHVLPKLAMIEDDKSVDGLLVLLNTVGGDVEAGLAIAEMIASLSVPTVSLVLGGGHSIGVPMAVSADYSFVVPSATMVIHPVRTNGMFIGVAQSYRNMEKIQDRITTFISSHTHMSQERLEELMLDTTQLVKDVGTMLEGPEAVKEGLIDEVGASLEKEAREDKRPLAWKNMLLLIGVSFFVSSLSKDAGVMVASVLPVFDKATWTVLLVTAAGLIAAMTPFGKIKGTEEVSNIILYIVVAMIASRADISAMGNAPVWLAAGFLILLIHVAVMVILAKVIKMDIFTCAVASLANVGGTATAPVLAGAYSSALVPVGILMALLGNIIGTPGGAFVGHLMSLIG